MAASSAAPLRRIGDLAHDVFGNDELVPGKSAEQRKVIGMDQVDDDVGVGDNDARGRAGRHELSRRYQNLSLSIEILQPRFP